MLDLGSRSRDAPAHGCAICWGWVREGSPLLSWGSGVYLRKIFEILHSGERLGEYHNNKCERFKMTESVMFLVQ